MNLKLISKWQAGASLAVWLGLLTTQAAFGTSISLEGQNKGDTNNWYSGNLQNWVELDYIPCRVHFAANSQGNNQTITVYFASLSGTVPGFQDLYSFSTSSNVVFAAAPTLSAPASSSTWSYTFTVNVLNSQPGDVWFFARLAAGSHLNPGSSLALSGKPSSMGNLQIHKPAAGPGAPDLAITKAGSTSVCQGGMISYTLIYTNRATTNTAVGTQISDILPAGITVDTNSLAPNARPVGNTIYWDLTNVVGHASGQVTFRAAVDYTASLGLIITNFAQVLSSENDANMADNNATWLTTVNCGCTNPSIITPPASAAICPAQTANFSVVAGGPGPLGYQWRKNSSSISGATNSAYSISSVSSGDAGSYDVVVGNLCGSITSSVATLTVNQNLIVSSAPASRTNCAGTSASFSVTASGTGLVYQWYKGSSALPGQTGSGLTLNNVSAADAGSYNVVVSGICGNGVTNSAILTVNPLVAVSSGPVSLTNCPGTVATFSVTATGTGLAYQWYKGSNALGGQTSSSLTLNNISAADAGTYRVAVTGICGGSVTNSATLTVNQDLAVSVVPSSATNCPNSSTSFHIVASGTGLSFQWYKNGSLLPGQTTSSISLSNIGPADAAVYSVVANGVCGNTATNTATLEISENVVISSAPASVTTCAGTSASFDVTASGTALSYQWYKGSSQLVGETSSTLTLNNVGTTDAGSYSVVVSGVCGGPLTNSASLTVNEPAVVSSAPVSLTNCPGTTATFSVSATGAGLTYQWYKGGSALTGQTDSSLSLNNVSPVDADIYSVIISGICGSAATNSASLTVNQELVVVVPAGATNCAETTIVFNALPSGTGLSFQWSKDGTVLAGQTGSSLTLSNLTSSDAGIYTVFATGICGNSASNSGSLTINEKTAISTGPLSRTNCPGTIASFNVSATGTDLSYQWYKDGSALSGQSGSSLILNDVSANDNALYSVVVSGSCGSLVTNSATLTVNEELAISTAPASLTNCAGTDASFSVAATGTGLTYAWFKGTNLLSSETGSSLNLTNVSAVDAGDYSVVVNGACGAALTNGASLVVNEPTLVSSAPTDQTVCAGASATFSVSATGTGLTYQWLHNGLAMAGASSSSLNLVNVQSADAGRYDVIVDGACGAAQTNWAVLVVNAPVVISSAPVSLTNCPGTSANFNVSASGTGLSYQWYKGITALAGQTDSSLSLNNLSAADAGSYSVVVSGVCGNSLTSSATLTVNEDVVVAVVPASATNCPGTSASFGISASGTGLSYQWFKDGSALPGQTGNSLILNNLTAADTGVYSVSASGVCGNSASNSAVLAINQNVTVSSAPVSVTKCPGSSANFSVSASGTGLSYQWYKGSSPLTGHTGSSLSLNNVSAADTGIYTVVVSGTCGSSISNSASLTVNEDVVVVNAPRSLTNCPGSDASFSVSASGTDLNYQWYKGTNALSSETGSSLTLTNVSAGDVETYSVVVSGACGNAATNSASLTINQVVLVSSVPADQTVCAGANASFSVSATGTGLSYQWYKGSGPLSGQTGSSLSLNNVSAADAGTYTVIVSGVCGNSISNSANLTVNQSVAVSSAPANVTICQGASASFTVTATGTALTYQWYKGASILTGQTGNSLVLNNVTTADAGTYTVVVSGMCGNAITHSASLTVNQNVMISSAPVSSTNCPRTDATFSVSATGTGLSYQWFYGNTELAGETGSSLTLYNVTASDAGIYSVVVSGVCGSTVTNVASLIVNQRVVVSSRPASATNCPGTSATFSVSANGTGLSYQWYKGTTALTGQTASNLSLNNISAADAGTYSVVVSGTCGSSISNSASLTVNQNVVVLSGPSSITTCAGTTANFSVAANGSGLSYQWYKGINALSGQTGSSLSLNNVSSSDTGNYSVVVSGTCGSVVSSSASLTVNQNLMVSSAPVSVTKCPGTSASFNVSATGTGLSYQWYKGAAVLGGQTTSSLSLNDVSAADAGTYSVVVSGVCGSSISNSATLTVNEDVMVSSAPAGLTTCPGTDANFTVSAIGTALNYQWYKGTNALSGQTGSSLTLTNVSAADAGIYIVVVGGACGNALTNSVNLTVNANVLVSSAPADQTVCAGASASFSVSASGTGLNYQWLHNGSVVAGASSSSLNLADAQSADAGQYDVVVSGACGAAQTNRAMLVVNAPVVVTSAPVNQTVCAGASAGFSVSATGTGLTYQWYKGGSPLTGQTGSSLLLNNVSAADAGTYSVIVSGLCDNAVTKTTSLTVNENVLISGAPVSLTNCPGTTAAFSISASGTGLSFQWYKGNSALAGQTSSSLSLNNVSASDAGTYSVVVSGICGNAVTNSASLTLNQNVTVSSPPLSLTNCPGTSASFTVSATGTGLSYQWYKGNNVLLVQTGSSLGLNNVSAVDAATYSVVVSGTCGNSVTNSASLTVNQNVAVSSAPISLTNCPGTSASFSVSATGTGLSYQWYKGANALTGQTGSSLVLNNVSATDAGTYTVVVSGTCGSSISNSAGLTVNQNVAVSSAPLSLTNCPGTSASFSVSATGTGLTYRWYKGASALNGQTGSSLVLNNVSATDAGAYSVVVSGTCGSSISNSASLTVNQAVAVSSQPTSLTNCAGTSASFSVNATGTGLTYQWYKGANALSGQTASSLVLNNISATDAGTYTVVVSGTCGNSVTNGASLTVNQNVAVSSAPISLTNCAGTTASFSVNATGTSLTYKWYKGGNALNGQTGSSLILNNVSASDAGLYTVVVSGACGGSISNSASLTVNQNVAVSSAPISLTNCAGTTASFSVNATGTGLTYQWYKGASALNGQTGSSLLLNNVSASDAGTYTVVVSGTCGSSISNSASLTVNQNVAISSAPLSLTNCPGTTASFSVGATGTGLTYQWYKDGNKLPGQTGTSLTLLNVSTADAATYSVAVSGVCGNTVNSSATLSVVQGVAISSAPANTITCAGTTASFSVSASGSGLGRQWYKGGTALAGQTTDILTLNNVSAADAGTYSVVVSGSCGNAVTNSATLTVNQSVSATPLTSLAKCPGQSVTFTTISGGTAPITCQWQKNGNVIAGQTNDSLTMNNLSAADAGTYSVSVSGACGTITQSATLIVNTNVSASALTSLVKNVGATATFSTLASGTGPFAYVWKKNGTIISGQSGSTLTLNNLSSADAGTYTVEVSGACTTVAQAATLSINQPPTVTIVNPTNGAYFVFPQAVPIFANASDPDGSIQNVQLFQGSTQLSESYVGPYSFFWTNVPVGSYQLTARATDNSGLMATSSVVNITMLDHAPVAGGPIQLNRQNGLFEQNVTISNPTLYAFTGIRLWIYNLTAETKVFNATGTNNGIPYIDYNLPIGAGGSATLLIQYYIPSRIIPSPIFVPQLLGTDYGAAKPAAPAPMIESCIRLADGSFRLEFDASAGYSYYVQYCSNLGGVWKTAASPVVGTGGLAQWVDNGVPNTESHPSTQQTRFYRLLVVSP